MELINASEVNLADEMRYACVCQCTCGCTVAYMRAENGADRQKNANIATRGEGEVI